jgi:hypothetical protein
MFTPRAAIATIVPILIALVVPCGIQMANARHAAAPLPPSYLPALEGNRARARFEENRLDELRAMQPGYVVIGDSMAGTRIDERRLGELAHAPIAPLLHPGSGSAFWYLALKNWVIASGIHPRMVFVFFPDTNLTDVVFRLDQQFSSFAAARRSISFTFSFDPGDNCADVAQAFRPASAHRPSSPEGLLYVSSGRGLTARPRAPNPMPRIPSCSRLSPTRSCPARYSAASPWDWGRTAAAPPASRVVRTRRCSRQLPARGWASTTTWRSRR